MANKESTATLMLLTGARSYRAGAFHRAAERLGVTVVPVVNMEKALAEQWGSTTGVAFDAPNAAETIAALARQHVVDAVLAVDDSGTLIAARVAALLGLAHNSPEGAEAARDKAIMRQRLAEAGVPCPWFRRYSTADELEAVTAELPFPVVVKPLNLNGSRGVIRADDPVEAVAAAQRLRAILDREAPDVVAHPFLVEAFIPGVEVALEGLLDQGRLQVLALFDKPDPLDGPFFEETLYVTPSRLPFAVQDAIADCVTSAAQALGLVTGPVHAELRVNESGPWILEVAGRSIGGLCSQVLRFGVSASLEELIVGQACGLPGADTARELSAAGVMMIPIPEGGILKAIAGVDAAAALPHIEGIEITAKLNYSITPLPEGESYLGFIFARARTPEQVEQALRQAHALLQFTIVPELPLLS